MKKHIAKILAIALSLALLFCLVPGKGNEVQAAGASAANLLADKNYSLEDTAVNAFPADWSGAQLGPNAKVTEDKAFDGNKSLKLNIPENATIGAYIYTPRFDVSGISTLRISVNYLTTKGARVGVQFLNASGTVIAGSAKWWAADATTDTEWGTFTQTHAVYDGAVYAQIYLQQLKDNTGDTYFDNIVVEPAVSLWCYDGISRATYVYDALNVNFENDENYTSLGADGWVFGSLATSARTAVEQEGTTTNHVLKCDNSAVSGTYALYTPAIDVSGKNQVTASMNILSNVNTVYYLYFYKADGTQLAAPSGVNPQAALSRVAAWSNGAKDQWHTVAITLDVPSDAAYARIMLYRANSTQGLAYYDNIQLNDAGAVPTPTTSTATQPSTSAATQPSTGAATQASTSAATQAAGTSAPQSTAGTTAPAASNPDTGDTTGITAMMVVMILAVTTLVAMVSTKFNFRTHK